MKRSDTKYQEEQLRLLASSADGRRLMQEAIRNGERREARFRQREATLSKPVFHEIDEIQVFDAILAKVIDLEQKRVKWKAERVKDTSYVDPMIDEWIEKEVTVYAEVRVRSLRGVFHLVYPDSTSGTGPFATRREAERFFLNGGR